MDTVYANFQLNLSFKFHLIISTTVGPIFFENRFCLLQCRAYSSFLISPLHMHWKKYGFFWLSAFLHHLCLQNALQLFLHWCPSLHFFYLYEFKHYYIFKNEFGMSENYEHQYLCSLHNINLAIYFIYSL